MCETGMYLRSSLTFYIFRPIQVDTDLATKAGSGESYGANPKCNLIYACKFWGWCRPIPVHRAIMRTTTPSQHAFISQANFLHSPTHQTLCQRASERNL